MFFISSVAEEFLSFANIIPEWLCMERQKKVCISFVLPDICYTASNIGI